MLEVNFIPNSTDSKGRPQGSLSEDHSRIFYSRSGFAIHVFLPVLANADRSEIGGNKGVIEQDRDYLVKNGDHSPFVPPVETAWPRP